MGFRGEVNWLIPSFRNSCIETENNTIGSSINWPSNLVNNVFANVHCFLTQSQGSIFTFR